MNFAAPTLRRLRSFVPSTCRRRIVLWLLLLCVAVLPLAMPAAFARPTEASRIDRRIAILVSHLMDRRHLSDLTVDDETSSRCLEMFIKMLDPRKIFFLQSDVDEFSSEKFQIDDYVKEGNVRLAKRIFDRFLERVEQRISFAEKLLDEDQDFSLDEEMIVDPDVAVFPKNETEAEDRWRKRVKFDLLTSIADDIEMKEAVERMHKRYHSIERRWQQTDNDELLELFLTALTKSFDPHSSYMSPRSLEDFTILMRLELNGIGASLESKYGETIVRQLVPGGAADKDGRLKVGDKIVGVAQGADGEMVDIIDMKINDVVRMIRGQPGSVVRLEVSPEDKSGLKVIDITRARIELKDREARSQILEEPAEAGLGAPLEHNRSGCEKRGSGPDRQDCRAGRKERRHPGTYRRDRSAQLLHGYARP